MSESELEGLAPMSEPIEMAEDLPDGLTLRATLTHDGNRYRLTSLTVSGPVVTGDHLRRIRVATLESNAGILGVIDPDTTIPRPASGPYPDGFYRSVADAYAMCLRLGVPPAPVIAHGNGVPRSTVHRWVRQARARGFLPPAERGRAG